MSVITEEQILEQLKQLVAENRVMLFMKGTPEAPRCGFSARVAERLFEADVEFAALDIFLDPRIRTVLSGWSNWPTIPQLFVAGELVGGCDIVEEMAASGELQKLLADPDDEASKDA